MKSKLEDLAARNLNTGAWRAVSQWRLRNLVNFHPEKSDELGEDRNCNLTAVSLPPQSLEHHIVKFFNN